MKKIKTIFLGSFLALSLSGSLFAQQAPGLPVLIQNTDTRSMGMGYTASYNDRSRADLFGNFASSLFRSGEMGIGVAYDLSLMDKVDAGLPQLHSAGIDYRYGRHAFGLGGRYMGGLTLQGRNEMGNTYEVSPADVTVDLAYGYRFTDRLGAFVGADYIHSYNGRHLDAFGFSAGLLFRSDCRMGNVDGAYALGLFAKNLGPRYTYSGVSSSSPLPAYVSFNPSLLLHLPKEQTLAIALSGSGVVSYADQPFLFGLGLEYGYRGLALRTGYHSGYEQQVTLGGGYSLGAFALDLGYAIGLSGSSNLLKVGLACHF